MKKTTKTPPIVIDGNNLNLEKAKKIANGTPIKIAQASKERVNKSQKLVHKLAQQDKPIYAINTGFGYFANKKISEKDLKVLQSNILKSHASGFGKPLEIKEARLAMVLRLHVLLKGFTGVRFELCQQFLKLINAGIYPVIPEYGSVGASGDLAPLAHLALPIIGLGQVFYKKKIMSASQALKLAKIRPLNLAEKEGIGLINGTQVMLSIGSLALMEAFKLIDLTNKITALSLEALDGHIDAFDPKIHYLRGHKGQNLCARAILSQLKDSDISKRKNKRWLVQDPYSLRCSPQVHGASYDAFEYAKTVLEHEMNGATDNPLVFADMKEIISGGNFHGQPIALAFDFSSIAAAELGNISERRLELLINPNASGLPAFLTPYEGTHSGYMAAQYLAASLVNENKLLANPSSTDSIPGNVGVEDHVSMGMTGARKFKKIVNNVRTILAIELTCAAQAIDLSQEINGKKKLGKGVEKLYAKFRKSVKKLTKDRIIAEDIKKAVEFLEGYHG